MKIDPSRPPSAALDAPGRRGSALLRWLVGLVVLGGLGYGGWWGWKAYGRRWLEEGAKKSIARATYVVTRRELPITVIASGSLKARKSEVIASKVEGKATILEIIKEGTLITPEDVKNGKVLVLLDAADLQERLIQQQITFANAESAYTQAREAYDIQKSQVESDIQNGKLNVKFGRLDLEKYVGEKLADLALADTVDLLELAKQHAAAARTERQRIEASVAEAIKQVERALVAAAADRSKKPNPTQGKTPAAASIQNTIGRETSALAVTQPARADKDGPIVFGGAARQNKRKLEADIDLAIEEFKRAADKLVWTARLESKGYVSHNELEADQLAVKRELINLEQALSAREIFLRYEFPKDAEEFLSIYRERVRELSRIEARGRSALAQKEADRRSKEATFKTQKDKLEKLKKQVGYCTIRATTPGLVIYASSGARSSRHSYSTPIDKGSTVHERQEILRMPDLSSLAVEVGIHESLIGRVKLGLPAEIRIEAMPTLALRGTVVSVDPLPSPKDWWNRGYMEFSTDVSIDGQLAPDLKPGMSASVEIHVRTLHAVVAVPVQAVSVRAGRSVVYVVQGDKEVPREVELGEANETLVEVRKGLTEDERILSQAPRDSGAKKKADEKGNGKKKGGPPAVDKSKGAPDAKARPQPRTPDGKPGAAKTSRSSRSKRPLRK